MKDFLARVESLLNFAPTAETRQWILELEPREDGVLLPGDQFICSREDAESLGCQLVTEALVEDLASDRHRGYGLQLTSPEKPKAISDADREIQAECLRWLVLRCLTIELKLAAHADTLEEQSRWNMHHHKCWESLGEPLRTLQQLLSALLKRKLPLSTNDFVALAAWGRLSFVNPEVRSFWPPTNGIVNTLINSENTLGCDGYPLELKEAAHQFAEDLVEHFNPHNRKLGQKLHTAMGGSERVPITAGEAWSDQALADINASKLRSPWAQLIQKAQTAKSAKPSKKWLKDTLVLRDAVGEDRFYQAVKRWLPLVDKPRTERIESWSEWEPDPNHMLLDHHADILRGLVWIAAEKEDEEMARLLGTLALSCYRKVPGVGPRAVKLGNAAVYALGRMTGMPAIGQLSLLAVKVKFGSAQKQIDKALNSAAEREGLPRDDIEEMAVPAYGLTEVGQRTEQLGDFRCELVVASTTSVVLRWIKPDGKPQKSVPKAVKDNFADELKELKAAAKDIQKMLPAQRDRIDLLQLKQKTWPYATWAERYLNHPLVGTLARRLIWTFDEEGKKVDATCLDDQLVDVSGDSVEVGAEATVSLWHPIGHDEAKVVAWRRFFEEREIKQPFKQAHREVYLLTDAERNTGTYSNRYASHVLKQHQYNALCGIRGWKNTLRLCVDDEYPPTFINLPEWKLRAEFWVEGIGDEYGTDTNDTGTYHYLATDQVRFYAIDAEQLSAHAGGGGYGWGGWRDGAEPEPLPLDQVPALVLSEILRDVDLFVGVASVGNDPNWQDGGPEGQHRDYWHDYSFGDLSATAKTRREILERLVPRLKIAERCSFDEKFLLVRGDMRTYKIHLGSSNILMEPNDQYLCIVPGRGAGPGDKIFLPFEGDQRLAVILSKAFLLADDKKIKDATILSQIGRVGGQK